MGNKYFVEKSGIKKDDIGEEIVGFAYEEREQQKQQENRNIKEPVKKKTYLQGKKGCPQ